MLILARLFHPWVNTFEAIQVKNFVKPFVLLIRAVDSFSNPEVLAVIAKLQQEEIRLCPFSEPPNSGGALAPPAPPLSTALLLGYYHNTLLPVYRFRWQKNQSLRDYIFRGVDSGGAGGARAPLEFQGSEKRPRLISVYQCLAITASNFGFEKIFTALILNAQRVAVYENVSVWISQIHLQFHEIFVIFAA